MAGSFLAAQSIFLLNYTLHIRNIYTPLSAQPKFLGHGIIERHNAIDLESDISIDELAVFRPLIT